MDYRQTHYGGSAAAIGSVPQLDQQDETIVGVVPEAFRFLDSDIYVPLMKPGAVLHNGAAVVQCDAASRRRGIAGVTRAGLIYELRR